MDEIYTKTGSSGKSRVLLPDTSSSVLMGFVLIPKVDRNDHLKQGNCQYINGEKSYVSLHLVNRKKLSISTHLANFMRYVEVNWYERTSRFISLIYTPLSKRWRSALHYWKIH
jgi:hypothetical protein